MLARKCLDIELMRILAAFFVIFNHTGTTAFFLFPFYDVHTVSYWGCLFLSVFCKFSVPLFFMISGALLLDREEEAVKMGGGTESFSYFFDSFGLVVFLLFKCGDDGERNLCY